MSNDSHNNDFSADTPQPDGPDKKPDNNGDNRQEDSQQFGSDPMGFFQMFGGNSDELLKHLSAMGIDPSALPQEFHKISSDPTGIMGQMMASFQSLMGTPSGPVNWQIALNVALHHREFTQMTRTMRGQHDEEISPESDNPLAALLDKHAQQGEHTEDDPAVSAGDASAIRDALSVADLWLDSVCGLTPDIGGREAWTREQWLRNTLPAWKEICEPVAKNATRAISEALGEQLERMGLSDAQASATIPEFGQLFGPMKPQELLQKMSGGIFAMQIGQALGMLSQDTFGSTDIGFPLTDTSTAALVAVNVKDFGKGLDIPDSEVLQYLAVREAAYSRLYNTVPWLRSHLLTAVTDYASHISIDPQAMDEAMMSMEETLRQSGMDPDSIEQGFSIDIFSTTHSHDQESSLLKLQTTLAVVEGWVEEVTTAATISHLPHAMQLREMVRRRRFSGTPAEQLLKTLVGLEMRPKRVRDAAVIWQLLTREKGIDERDKLWSHPDVMPTPKELEDPHNFLVNRAKQSQEDAAVDAELENLLKGTLGWAEGLEPDQDSEGDAKASPTD
ncbi:MAG: zinc-dependent metalloprotease [Actinomycetaceae bacterium]|nr:zinc-dependent metalloprotease [Actinomycetaceae bacterium]